MPPGHRPPRGPPPRPGSPVTSPWPKPVGWVVSAWGWIGSVWFGLGWVGVGWVALFVYICTHAVSRHANEMLRKLSLRSSSDFRRESGGTASKVVETKWVGSSIGGPIGIWRRRCSDSTQKPERSRTPSHAPGRRPTGRLPVPARSPLCRHFKS